MMPFKSLLVILLITFTWIFPALGREAGEDASGRATKSPAAEELPVKVLPPDPIPPKKRYYPMAFVIENDVMNQTDDGYTHGFTLSFTTPWVRESQDSKLDILYHLPDRLSLVARNQRKRRMTFALIHDLYTPTDLNSHDLIDDDLPYSGVLFAQLLVDYQSPKRADAWGIILGMVGPASQGEWVQKGGHKMVGVAPPNGWDNQTEDEMLLNLTYTHKWKTEPYETCGLNLDVIPYAGASLGNLLTDIRLGVSLRLGNHDTRSFSTIYKGRLGSLPDIGDTPSPLTCFFLAGLEGAITFYSVLLDGNTYKESHKVTRIPESMALFTGVGLQWQKCRLGLFWVEESRRFKEQRKHYGYGSLTLGWLF